MQSNQGDKRLDSWQDLPTVSDPEIGFRKGFRRGSYFQTQIPILSFLAFYHIEKAGEPLEEFPA
jgi:hypothetical protein